MCVNRPAEGFAITLILLHSSSQHCHYLSQLMVGIPQIF